MNSQNIKNTNRKNSTPLQRDKSWENWMRKTELILDFRGQNETEYNSISILLL